MLLKSNLTHPQPPRQEDEREVWAVACCSCRHNHMHPLCVHMQEDELEVWAYRGSLLLVAACYAASTLASLAGGADAGGAAAAVAASGSALAAAGAAGLGAATVFIHVYVTPLKQAVQALAAAGTAGGVYLMAAHPEVPLPQYIAEHPTSIWLVGPAAAALTGIAGA